MVWDGMGWYGMGWYHTLAKKGVGLLQTLSVACVCVRSFQKTDPAGRDSF